MRRQARAEGRQPQAASHRQLDIRWRLEYALERELSNSRFVNVVPRERIEDSLRLMKKASDTTVDAALGREICLRDGAIRVLVTGRLEKIGSTFALSGQIVDPARGVVTWSGSEDARTPDQLLAATRHLSNGVRERLGEELGSIRASAQNLEKVTTPSLRALQLYTQALALADPQGRSMDYASAAEMLKQAVTVDPGFAAAHALLAWSLRAKGSPSEEWLKHARRAVARHASSLYLSVGKAEAARRVLQSAGSADAGWAPVVVSWARGDRSGLIQGCEATKFVRPSL